jgi:hypothetical protein
MPACVAFDPGTQLFTAEQYDHTNVYESTTRIPFSLDPKKFAAALYSSQLHAQQHLLLTPPPSPESAQGSPFDQVPNEILDQIIELVHSDAARGVYDVLRDISACCLVSRQFHAVATTWLYRHVPISDPYAFTKVTSSYFR